MRDLLSSHPHIPARAWQRLQRRSLSERRWSAVTLWAGIVIVVTITLLSFAAPLLGLPDPNTTDLFNTLKPPSSEHLFGTDDLGRDIFTRVLYAGQVDLTFGIITTYLSLVIGLVIGALSGYFGGLLDTIIMRVVDLVISFPFIVLILAITAITGPGLTGAYIGVLVVSWALYARLTRGEMLALREQQYILNAQTLGYSTSRIIFVHSIPNLLRSNLVFSMSDIVLNILTLAALSYLGLGVAPPTPEWGEMVAQGQKNLFNAWWMSTLPGLVIVLVGVGFSLIGDGLADRLGEGGAS
ncbi:MAG: ABC transporter permease [Anaerolineae bacterium]|nr:ABC transporter permease [Anaerolineae bacterium]